MKMKLAALLAVSLYAHAAVTVTLAYPQPGEIVRGVYQNPGVTGTASTTSGSITGVAIYIDGVFYGNAVGTASWQATIDANGTNPAPGSHTIFARATDSFSVTGDSPTVTFSTQHITPICNHTFIGGNIYCEKSVSTVVGLSTTLDFPAGHQSGNLIITYVFGLIPPAAQAGVLTNIDASQTTFSTGSPLLGTWPAAPFDACISDKIARTNEKIRVTGLSGNNFTVLRGQSGNCVSYYADETLNLAGQLVPAGPAASHLAGDGLVNFSDQRILNPSDITNTAGDTWSYLPLISSGAGDYSVAPCGFFYTFAHSTVASDSITLPATFTAAAAVIYSGVSSLRAWNESVASAGPMRDPFADSGSFATVSGDLLIGFASGAPTGGASGWDLRSADTVRPYTASISQYATGTSANASFIANSEGHFVWGASFTPTATAAQSIVLSTQTVSNSSVPACNTTSGTCRFEISIDQFDTTYPSSTHVIADPNFLGINFQLLNISGVRSAQVYMNTGSGCTGGSSGSASVAFGSSTFATLRGQVDFAAKTLDMEGWDINGTKLVSAPTVHCTSMGSTFNGISVTGGGSGKDFHIAYMRGYSTLVGLNAKPPTTAQSSTGGIFQWKFEGDLSDSFGGYTGVLSPSSGAYSTTLGTALVVALINTVDADSYSNWKTQKVGTIGQLDGSRSYSQSPVSDSVSHAWTQLTTSPAAPSTLTWPDGQSVANPHFGNLLFGGYTVRDVVTDAGGVPASVDLTFGAVVMDANGVVIPSDPNVTKVFGPLIAFGKNPWGYADERNCTAVNLQINGTDCIGNIVQSAGNPYYTEQASIWSVPATGTISYPFAGVGPSPGQGCYGSGSGGGSHATLNGSITASTTSIPIHHAECLSGLLSLPTWVLFGNSLGSQEMVRVVATTATTGDATLTISSNSSGTAAGVDGRGMAGAIYLNAQPLVAAQSWADGTIAGEMRIAGSGTQFSTDASRPLCPAGVPGPPGAVTYATGTVSGTGGSTTLTGHSTSWTQSAGGVPAGEVFLTDSSHNTYTQQYIRITSPTHGGVPFAFWAFVVSVAADNSSIVISRPLPADFDAGNFSYKITGAAYWSLEFVVSGNTDRAIQQPAGCESNTSAFTVPSHDIPSIDLTTQSGLHISYKTALGAQSAFGPNFYGTGFAERAFYYRSGYTPALTAANLIDDYWVRDPEICSGYCGGLPLLQGGGAIGGIANRVLNSSTLLSWGDVTQFAVSGALDASANCNNDDPRDQGYLQSWLALVAIFDTDPTRHAAWIAGLNTWVIRDQTCRRNASDGYGVSGTKPEQVNSWAGSSLFNATTSASNPTLTLSTGSATATSPTNAFFPGMCAGQDDGSGFIHITPGSTSATIVSGSLASGYRITITDTSVSPPLVITAQYSVSGTAVTLAIVWPGTTAGNFHFMSENSSLSGFMSSIGLSNFDWAPGGSPSDIALGAANNQQLQPFWACKYNNTGSITLNRPWDGVGGNNYHMFSYVVSGFEVQPFMDGVKASAMNWAAQVSDSGIVSAYRTMLSQLGTWMATYGVDLNAVGTLGTYYNRVSGGCEPAGAPNNVTLFDTIHSVGGQNSCGSMGRGTTTGDGLGEFTSRVNTVEAGTALNGYYSALPGSTRSTFVSKYYGAIFGKCSLTSGGGATYYCDGNYVNTGNELSNASLGAYKWTGFFFGVGGLFSNTWPATLVSAGLPATPTGVSATPGNTQISLSWGTATGATTYNVYRGLTPGGEGVTPYVTGLLVTSYLDTGLTNGTTYYYKISAVNSFGEGGLSTEVSATPVGVGTVNSLSFGGNITIGGSFAGK